MGTPDDQGMQIKQINLTCEDAAKLAVEAIEDDADSLILLLMGIMEKPSQVDAHMLITRQYMSWLGRAASIPI